VAHTPPPNPRPATPGGPGMVGPVVLGGEGGGPLVGGEHHALQAHHVVVLVQTRGARTQAPSSTSPRTQPGHTVGTALDEAFDPIEKKHEGMCTVLVGGERVDPGNASKKTISFPTLLCLVLAHLLMWREFSAAFIRVISLFWPSGEKCVIDLLISLLFRL